MKERALHNHIVGPANGYDQKLSCSSYLVVPQCLEQIHNAAGGL
jgi:hypothetical protein